MGTPLAGGGPESLAAPAVLLPAPTTGGIYTRGAPASPHPHYTMGQQQLLLLVLGIVIVGLAVVVGIQAFGENQKKANSDALVNDGVRIASDAQAWNLKPAAFGGGDGSFEEVSLPKLGYTLSTGAADAKCPTGQYENLNGCFALSDQAAGKVVITGTSAANKNQVVVTVTGTKPENIATVVSNT